MRIGQGHRRGQHARFANPLQAGQLAVAVEAVRAGEQRLLPRLAGRQDHGDAGAHGSPADVQRAVPRDQRAVSDAHAGDIGDRVPAPRRSAADRDSVVSCPHLGAA
jgi:hypothetical protein